MNDLNFKKEYPYIASNVFKQKDVNHILTIINAGRLSSHIKFVGYGLVTYDEDDTKMENAHLTFMEKFNRLKTNCLVFDVLKTVWNDNVYTKMYILKQNNVKDPTFSIVFHNEETGITTQNPCIEYAYDVLAQDIMRVIFNLRMHPLYEMYKRRKNISTFPSIIEVEECYRKIKETPFVDCNNDNTV